MARLRRRPARARRRHERVIALRRCGNGSGRCATERVHKPRIGLANGWFYQADRRDPASFYDVTQGDNQRKLVTCCSATAGYDQASGLGVPDWSVLPGQLPTPAK